jgi:ribosomal protein S18 acetylase RimI-like enzyme
MRRFQKLLQVNTLPAEHVSDARMTAMQLPAKPLFRIRAARLNDLDELLTLENSSFNTDLLTRQRMRHWIRAENGIFLVAVTANPASSTKSKAKAASHLLGYCLLLTRRNSRAARAYSLAISTAAQGQGLGRKLMESAERYSRNRGCTSIRLEVAQGNTGALALYEKLGYSRITSIAGYYENGEDAWRMQKLL